jgi:hypothetical protein
VRKKNRLFSENPPSVGKVRHAGKSDLTEKVSLSSKKSIFFLEEILSQ